MPSSRRIVSPTCRLVLPACEGASDHCDLRITTPPSFEYHHLPQCSRRSPHRRGLSFLGTSRLPGLGWDCFLVSFESSQSSYGCGSLRSWNPAVVVSRRSNGTWESRPFGQRLESSSDVTLGQLPLPVLLVILKIRITGMFLAF